jgi:hypothetical protein
MRAPEGALIVTRIELGSVDPCRIVLFRTAGRPINERPINGPSTVIRPHDHDFALFEHFVQDVVDVLVRWVLSLRGVAIAGGLLSPSRSVFRVHLFHLLSEIDA